jgi:SAM-dependent methyltransferase
VTAVFGPAYARLYDAMNAAKDYEAECEALERVFARHAERPLRRVLDLGCGTGGHALAFAAAGLDVTGVDRSPQMLELAAAKAERRGSGVTWLLGDARELDLGRRFDAVMMLFAVLGYQRTDADVVAVLDAAHRHLEPGGVIAFDVWDAGAVLAQGPSLTRRELALDGERFERLADGRLEAEAGRCVVDIEIAPARQGEAVPIVAERHEVRFFSRLELESLCTAAGLEIVLVSPWPPDEEGGGEPTWSVLIAARPR